MTKILGGGGLGDAAMLFAKLDSFDSEIEFTHVMVKGNLMKSVEEFYQSQKVRIKMKNIPNWDWKEKNKKNFDIILDTSVRGGEDSNTPINPFPKIYVDDIHLYNIVLAPSSGRDNERNFGFKEIADFVNKHKEYRIVLVGKEKNAKQYDNLNVVNLINKTNIQELINIVAGSRYIVAPSGFISIIGCMLKKEVYTKDDRMEIRNRYYHNKWNNYFINQLKEVNVC